MNENRRPYNSPNLNWPKMQTHLKLAIKFNFSSPFGRNPGKWIVLSVESGVNSGVNSSKRNALAAHSRNMGKATFQI